MFLKRTFKSLRIKIRLLCNFPRKLLNTAYYCLLNKDNVLVVNAPLFQTLNRIRHFNLGDDLNFYLLSELSGKKVIAYNAFFHKDIPNIMAIGSVIDWLGNQESIVWGSGFLIPASDNTKQSKSRQIRLKRVAACRGEKTRTCLANFGIDCPSVYGDPALLLPFIYFPSVKRVKGRVGIIPHYKDLKNVNVVRLMKEFGDHAILIKVQGYRSWKEIVLQMLSCEYILSSSLHGLILSDAYGIPNQWVSFSELLAGGEFKFNDYYSSVRKEGKVVKVSADTATNDLLCYKSSYKKIVFDPKPLLRSCPFEITHPGIISYLKRQ